MRKVALLLACLCVTAIDSIAQAPILPAKPQATPLLTSPTLGTAACPTLTSGSNCIRIVAAGNSMQLQEAINAATCGDTLLLASGSTYSGNFSIPVTSCSGWIEIASSAFVSLPSAGTRISPTDSNLLAKISTPNVSPAIQFLPGSNHWRILGIEITTSYQSTSNVVYGLVSAGLRSDGSAILVQTQLPSYLIFDHIYIHGSATTNVKRGIQMDIQSAAIVDSYCDEIHYNANDSQCFASWNGSGPFLIQNNFVQAGAEDILFGGADPSINGLVPSDITIVGNTIQKNLSWRGAAAPYNWIIKNLIELKNAQRVLIDGNVLQYIWAADQTGYAILLTPRNQDGNCPWCVVQDVTITHNLIQHVADGITVACSDNNYPSLPSARVLVQNNEFADVNSVNWGGHGWIFFINTTLDLMPPHDLTLDHNTSFPDSTNGAMVVLGDSGSASNLQMTNLLSGYGAYGIFGTGAGSGTPALTTFVNGEIYDRNVFINSTGTSAGKYPTGTLWTTLSTVGFTNSSAANYQLLATSPYHNAGTDGKDIGVWDWTCLNYDAQAALTGQFNANSQCSANRNLLLQPPTDLKAVVLQVN